MKITEVVSNLLESLETRTDHHKPGSALALVELLQAALQEDAELLQRLQEEKAEQSSKLLGVAEAIVATDEYDGDATDMGAGKIITNILESMKMSNRPSKEDFGLVKLVRAGGSFMPTDLVVRRALEKVKYVEEDTKEMKAIKAATALDDLEIPVGAPYIYEEVLKLVSDLLESLETRKKEADVSKSALEQLTAASNQPNPVEAIAQVVVPAELNSVKQVFLETATLKLSVQQLSAASNQGDPAAVRAVNVPQELSVVKSAVEYKCAVQQLEEASQEPDPVAALRAVEVPPELQSCKVALHNGSLDKQKLKL